MTKASIGLQDLRRRIYEIPKPDGGVRKLGVPCVVDRLPRLLRQLKPDWPAGLLLPHCGAIDRISARRQVLDPKCDDIAATQLAVDRQIEHWQVARPSVHLQSRTDRPYMFWPSGGFWPIRLPLFQGSRRGVEDIACV